MLRLFFLLFLFFAYFGIENKSCKNDIKKNKIGLDTCIKKDKIRLDTCILGVWGLIGDSIAAEFMITKDYISYRDDAGGYTDEVGGSYKYSLKGDSLIIFFNNNKISRNLILKCSEDTLILKRNDLGFPCCEPLVRGKSKYEY